MDHCCTGRGSLSRGAYREKGRDECTGLSEGEWVGLLNALQVEKNRSPRGVRLRSYTFDDRKSYNNQDYRWLAEVSRVDYNRLYYALTRLMERGTNSPLYEWARRNGFDYSFPPRRILEVERFSASSYSVDPQGAAYGW